ncbi:hypothetical protein PVNG_01545 [Plasmodium vivax North Korean]|uniref:Uncharacterized protein n=1 Tax=Plasmodium vivax North Korean TaxID=1035514 RepID=A0A0J9U2G5_PLAVI|nr:hypothetical protein PVNG_01545 [Plasmodium vivax North Korean]
MELWKKWKDLYDYIKNKDDIQNIINSDRELCKIYPKYHTYITGIYETYKKECCEVYNGNCPYELNFKEWCHKEDLFTKLKCNDSEVVTTYTAQPGIYNSEQLETADGLLAKQETEERDGRVQVFLEEGTTRSPKPQEEEREQRGSSGTEEETVEAGREEPESSFGAGRLIDSDNLVAGPIGDPSESILPKNTGTIGATLAGSSLFLLMMYKVIKRIFNNYYHFMLIFILNYHQNLLIQNNYFFKYAYSF